MKKVFLSFALFACMSLIAATGYSETGKPIKYQTEIYVQSTNLP